MKIVTELEQSPWLIVIYGEPGIGKSTLASLAPKSFFFDIEKGLKKIKCSRTPNRITEFHNESEDSYGFVNWLKWFVDSEFQTGVIDTISGLEQLLTEKTIGEYNMTPNKAAVSKLSEIPWAQGYDMLAANWSLVMKMLAKACEKYHKNILLIGHSTTEKVEDPTTDSYERYTIDVHKKSRPIIVNNVDAVLFARQGVIVKDKENSSKLIAVTDGERYLHTLNKPSYTAKNRFGLAEKIKMHPQVFEELAK